MSDGRDDGVDHQGARPFSVLALVAVFVVAAVVVAGVVTVFVPSPPSEAAPAVQPVEPLHPGVRALRIDDPATHWSSRGFVEMVPPVRLPTSKDGRDKIAIWLKVGDRAIRARARDDGTHSLVFPPGTIADRVETMGPGVVVDVRGTSLIDDGELFHVYVAESAAPSALVGWEWRRDDAAANASSTQALLARIRTTRLQIAGEPPPSDARHAHSLAAYERNNACAGCHVHERAPRVVGEAGHRTTDANGFFVPQSVLMDVLPLERHRPWEANVDDPFLAITCDGGLRAVLKEAGETRRYECPRFDVPFARLDVARALAADDERAVAMCRSRRYLYEHMDDDARAAFAPAFASCGIAG